MSRRRGEEDWGEEEGEMSRSGLKGRDLVNTLQAALAHPPVCESVWAAHRTQKSPLLQ